MVTLRPKEKILLVKRRHRIVLMRNLFPELIIFCAVLIATIILFFSSLPSWPKALLKFIPSLGKYEFRYLLLFFLSLLLLFLWAVIFLVVANYYLDYWIVTNERTIHTELKGLFNRVSSSVNHDKIQDITVEVKGFLPTLLNFGNLYIETAGEFQRFTFKQIPNPYETKDIIFKAQKEYLRKMKKDGLL
jgi:uncharacterized membrane protein YdbT with pleckstrin-like domain